MADEDTSDKKEVGTEWMQKLWRPAMGWMYMLICLLDMAVFPVCWSLLQAMMHMPITQWNPLTLQGAGLFHIAMGAVLGISAFGRTQEKLAGTAANPTATSQIVTNNQNMSGNVAGGFGSGSPQGGMGGGFGSSTGGFGSGATTPTTGFSSGAPAFGAPSTGFGAPASGFGSPASTPTSSGFGAPAPSMATTGGFGGTTTAPAVTTGFGGKKAPAPQDDPIL